MITINLLKFGTVFLSIIVQIKSTANPVNLVFQEDIRVKAESRKHVFAEEVPLIPYKLNSSEFL